MAKKLIIVVDGCPIEYYSKELTPNIFKIAENGFIKTVNGVMPSVTNVNHASILSGLFPKDHNIVGNYYFDKETKEEGFIEEAKFMSAKTIIDYYSDKGKSTAFLSVKGKVLNVFGKNATFGINMQDLDLTISDKFDLSNPPQVDDLRSFDWIFESCFSVIKQENPDLVYCTTNDYLQHTYSPDMVEAKEVMETIDYWVNRIYQLDPSREIYITADHGMNNKNLIVDIQKKFEEKAYNAYCLLALKDRYIENHIYQESGTAYIYILDKSQTNQIYDFLLNQDYIDKIYTAEEASEELMLPSNNIGNFIITSAENVAFGELGSISEKKVITRTHGSKFETIVPLIAVNASKEEAYYDYALDIVRGILES